MQVFRFMKTPGQANAGEAAAAATIQRLGSGNGTSETTIYGIGFEAGEILRTLDASDVTTASAAADVNGLAEIDATSLDASDRVKIGVRNAADDAWVHGPITPNGEVYKGDVYILASLVGAGTARIGSGLLAVGGSSENAHDAADWTEPPGGSNTLTVADSRLKWEPTAQDGTYQILTWDLSPSRTRRWIVGEMGRYFSNSRWGGIGVGSAADRDAVLHSFKMPSSLSNEHRLAEITAGSFGTLEQRTESRSQDVLYMAAIKIESDGGSGLTITAHDLAADATMGPQDSTVAGTSAPLALMAEEVAQVEYGRLHDQAYWIIPVAGGTEDRIARIVDGAGNAVAEATFDANKLALIDVHAAFVADPTLAVTDLVALRIRDSGDMTTLQTLTPTDDGTYGEEGLFGGDVIYVDE